MSKVIYAVVFQGKITDGADLISVKAHMAKLLKADAGKMAVLFSGKPAVLKKTASKEEAIKVGKVLKKIGADVRLIQRKVEDQPAAKKAAAGTGDTSGLKVLPNKGNIVDPAPAPKAPDIDLSGLDVLENDGSLLVEPSVIEKLDLDLSDYEVAENDGSPLIAPSPEAPRLDAPDFGLDEPGAVLETLKEEVELVNPDISNISLADMEGDLLTEEEKQKTRPPPPPDVSNIKLS